MKGINEELKKERQKERKKDDFKLYEHNNNLEKSKLEYMFYFYRFIRFSAFVSDLTVRVV